MTTPPARSAASAQIELEIEGMTCATCVRRVERAVSALPQVEGASVNLATEKAVLTIAAGASTATVRQAAARAVIAAGYAVREVLAPIEGSRRVQLTISGMTCASCVRRVERALSSVEGVSSASVNLTTESAEVSVTTPVEPAKLVAAVGRAGYGAELISESRSASEEVEERRARRRAVIRGAGAAARHRRRAQHRRSDPQLRIRLGAVVAVCAARHGAAGVAVGWRRLPPRRAESCTACPRQHGHPGLPGVERRLRVLGGGGVRAAARAALL